MLLDKHEFLSHAVDLIDKQKFNHDEALLKHTLPLILRVSYKLYILKQ